jgi:hypothetical protein
MSYGDEDHVISEWLDKRVSLIDQRIRKLESANTLQKGVPTNYN